MLTYINTILLAWLVWQNVGPKIKERIYSRFGPGSWQLRIFGNSRCDRTIQFLGQEDECAFSSNCLAGF